ncbi:hypothetical protein IL54_2571 [Sphingobium sp. ba1]|jgi:hypothetical protein|nr:hypothetical protein IL54_2571 [Sphingobium sp. ba1]|tara:strand:+ start:1468 stop:1647 length:180 start_codon:yes stop_codon:yes gene_type:complete
MNKNAPTREGEGVDCLFGGDKGAHTTRFSQIQYLAARHGLSIHRAALIAPIAFGATGHV